MNSLESRIKEIALGEVSTENHLGGGMCVFEDGLPFTKMPPTNERMQAFIELYEKNKHKNTKNLVYIPPTKIGSRKTPKEIAAWDYFRFFNNFIEFPVNVVLESTTEKFEKYIIRGKIYQDFYRTPESIRLSHIKMLGNLNKIGSNVLSFSMTQTRELHSIQTAIILELVLTMNGFGEREINLGIMSGLLHDIATPPLSEQGKGAARKDLNEEDLISKVIAESKGLKQMIRKYGVKPEEVIGAVRGKGLIGQLVNSRGIDADTIAYTGTDYAKARDFFTDFTSQYNYRGRNLFSIYKDIRFKGDEIYFNNPEKVTHFLLLRAMLFDKIYMSESARAKEAFMAREFSRMWGREITVEKMLACSDTFLESIGHNPKNRLCYDFFNPIGQDRFKLIHAQKDMSRFDELSKRYNNHDTVVAVSKGFNPKTATKVRYKRAIIPVSEAMPEECKIIEDYSERMKYVAVYRYFG